MTKVEYLEELQQDLLEAVGFELGLQHLQGRRSEVRWLFISLVPHLRSTKNTSALTKLNLWLKLPVFKNVCLRPSFRSTGTFKEWGACRDDEGGGI